MKSSKFITAALIAAAAGISYAASEKGDEKVKIIHNGKVIEVAKKAVDAHLAHGDELYREDGPAPTYAPSPPPQGPSASPPPPPSTMAPSPPPPSDPRH